MAYARGFEICAAIVEVHAVTPGYDRFGVAEVPISRAKCRILASVIVYQYTLWREYFVTLNAKTAVAFDHIPVVICMRSSCLHASNSAIFALMIASSHARAGISCLAPLTPV